MSGPIEEAAQVTLGVERLRSGQREAVEAILEGHDVLAIFPSGYGKSAVYQLAGALLDGPTVVISPLIALQEDQLQAIAEQESGEARRLNSSMSAGQRAESLEAIEGGAVEFVLLAPEQLANEETLARLQERPPSLFVVDEAHCIVSWGHDFRPDYGVLGATIEALGHPRVLALTATAAPPVRDEIVERLGLRDAVVIARDLDRPNIELRVDRFEDEAAKRAALLEAVVAVAGAGIVYVATRARAEELAEALRGRGDAALAYHAGMAGRARQEAQTSFMAGEARVMVATTAFGMGVDKPDVRFVFHHDVSDSLDAYYQEIGRAGRDGAPALARLFYRPEDLGIRRFFAGGAGLDSDELEAVLERIGSGEERDLGEVADELDVSVPRLLRAVGLLEASGAVELTGPRSVRGTGETAEQAAQEAGEQQEQRLQFERTRVAMMQRYAEQTDCRRASLLRYFGEPFEPPCGNCDNCLEGHAVAPAVAAAGPEWIAVGAQVAHERFGAGQVVELEGGRAVVLFEEAGYRVIDLEAARELLRPI